MLVIKAQVIGESVTLLQSSVLATDTVEAAEVQFIFDEEWDGYTKTAIFWGTDDEEYTSEVVDDKAVIPHEVMTEVGKIRFGVYGVNGSKRLVSVKIPYRVVDGAYVSGS